MRLTPEGIERPRVLFRMVAQNVDVVVLGAHFEALISQTVPLVKDFTHLVRPSSQDVRAAGRSAFLRSRGKTEPPWALLRFVAGIAIDLEGYAHRVLAVKKG